MNACVKWIAVNYYKGYGAGVKHKLKYSVNISQYNYADA